MIRPSLQVTATQAPAVWQAGYDGCGVGIAVIDSGIEARPELGDRVVARQDFVYGRGAEAYDDTKHGTSVACCAAGAEGMGTAPGAHVIGLKAVDEEGYCWVKNVLPAINWAIENRQRYNIRVMNLSFYLDDEDPKSHEPVLQALERAAQVGIIPVVCIGNQGPDNEIIHAMGRLPHVITVAASDGKGTSSTADDTIADFSARARGAGAESKPDVTAPGVEVYTSGPDGSTRLMGGTSFSSPLVAGVIATWVEANPDLDVTGVRTILQRTSEKLANAPREAQGPGGIQAKAGLDMALRLRKYAWLPLPGWMRPLLGLG